MSYSLDKIYIKARFHRVADCAVPRLGGSCAKTHPSPAGTPVQAVPESYWPAAQLPAAGRRETSEKQQG